MCLINYTSVKQIPNPTKLPHQGEFLMSSHKSVEESISDPALLGEDTCAPNTRNTGAQEAKKKTKGSSIAKYSSTLVLLGKT